MKLYKNAYTFFFCLIGLCVLQFLINAENWPWFRGPTRQGISSETNVPTYWSKSSNIVWQLPVEGEGWSSPIIYGNKLFITTATDQGRNFRLLCVDTINGKLLWNKSVFDQTLARKESRNSYATPTPATDGSNVFVFAFDGSIAALNYDGSIIWSNRNMRFYSQHGPGVSVFLYEDLVIIPFDCSNEVGDKTIGWQKPWDKAFVVALNKKDGSVVWKTARGMSRIAHVTPNVLEVDRKHFLVSGAGDVVQGFDIQTGKLIWTFNNPGEGVVPSIVIGDKTIFAASGFGDPAVRAIKLSIDEGMFKPQLLWEYKKDVPMMSSFLYKDPFLFYVKDDGTALCLDAKTGKVIWRNKLGGHFSASPVWAEGKIYFISDEAETIVIRADDKFEVLARNNFDELCQASMAISGGRIFIRTETNLFCIGHK